MHFLGRLHSLPNMVSATDYDPFGMALEERQWQLSGVEEYSFSFNGKIEDAEILDRGRWQDYGFRAYRPDLGRFVSVDPLKGKYPQASTYAFVLNNPVIFIDPDGRKVKFADRESRKAYIQLRKAYKKADSGRYNDLIRMQKAKDVIYTINVNYKSDLRGNDGTVQLGKVDKERGIVNISVLVKHDVDDLSESSVTKDKRVVLADELEGGRQFLDSEMGFKIVTGAGYPSALGYDSSDEIKTQQATIEASEVLNIDLNDLQKAFQADADKALGEYYPKVEKGRKTADGGYSDEKLQGYIDSGKIEVVVFRRKNDKGKVVNVIFKK
jgi:RHS repeat-associated protein